MLYLSLSVPMTSVVAWIASLDDLKNCQVVSGIMRIQLMDSFFDYLNVRNVLLFHIIIMNFSIFCIGWSIEAGLKRNIMPLSLHTFLILQ